MSREIKFRGWTKASQKMIDLKELTPFALSENLDQDGLFLPFMDDIILMQFTGLKDKNGVDIYEGDIVAVQNRKRKAKTEPTYITTIVYKWCGFTLDKNDTYFTDSVCINKMIEVIGNIYANPELL